MQSSCTWISNHWWRVTGTAGKWYTSTGSFCSSALSGDNVKFGPEVRLYEFLVCRRYFLKHDPSKVDEGGNVEERYCKLEVIQGELSVLRGWGFFLIPSRRHACHSLLAPAFMLSQALECAVCLLLELWFSAAGRYCCKIYVRDNMPRYEANGSVEREEKYARVINHKMQLCILLTLGKLKL